MYDHGDWAWLLAASALVLFMTPGLAFFYGGMVRSKNLLGMLMNNFICMGLISVVWGVIGYSLAFGRLNDGGFLGNLDFAWMQDLFDPAGTAEADVTGNYNGLTMIYQATFAIITPALITGALADRMRFSGWLWFMGLWSVLVYSPVAHWVFGGGWLSWANPDGLNAYDFAGGAVVHINAGAAALVGAIILGKRKGWPNTAMPPHALPWTLLGAGVLWFGWFGFNAGSAGAANGQAVQAFINTNMAAGAAMLGWLIVERLKNGHATTLGAASGAVAGLVAITPCAGYVTGMSPIYIGLIAGAVCYLAVSLKFRFGYDDSLDVVGVHLVGGLVGALLLGIFADDAVNVGGALYPIVDGAMNGGGLDLLGHQAAAAFITLAYSFVASGIILLVLRAVLPRGIRVTDDEEAIGLDLTQHAETSYAFGELASLERSER